MVLIVKNTIANSPNGLSANTVIRVGVRDVSGVPNTVTKTIYFDDEEE